MSPAQCRAARALLDWTQQRLAEAARVGNATIRNFEAGRSEPQTATLDVLQRALEAAGVEFIPENGGDAGVRLTYFVHTEEESERLLFIRRGAPRPPGKWDGGKPAKSLPKLAKLNSDGWYVWEEPTAREREMASRMWPPK